MVLIKNINANPNYLIVDMQEKNPDHDYMRNPDFCIHLCFGIQYIITRISCVSWFSRDWKKNSQWLLHLSKSVVQTAATWRSYINKTSKSGHPISISLLQLNKNQQTEKWWVLFRWLEVICILTNSSWLCKINLGNPKILLQNEVWRFF